MTFTTVDTEPSFDIERSQALHEAVRFHRGADSDDPKTVLETANDFLVFLQGENA